jgi:hypothetical protein
LWPNRRRNRQRYSITSSASASTMDGTVKRMSIALSSSQDSPQ